MSHHWRRRLAAAVCALSIAGGIGAADAGALTAHHHRHHHAAVKPRARLRHRAGAVSYGPKTVAGHVAFGAFASGFTGSGLQIRQLERQLGTHLAIASSFQGMGDVFPDATERAEAATGHALLISWDLGDTAASRFTTFTDGAHDAYLAQVAQAVAAFGAPVFIRPWPEMNGDWSAFQPTADGSKPAGGTPQEFVAAWQYLVAFFRAHGATNAKWVFDPTADTYAQTTDVRTIFPGSSYVDVLGLDGYNWGNGGALRWESFQQIFTTQYNRLVAVDPTAPVWVCEFGSKEPTRSDGAPVDQVHSKAAWYRSLFASTGFAAIRALVFFDIDKERDWRLDSDAKTLRVVSAAVRAAA